MNSSSNVIWKIDENSGKHRLPYVLMLLLGIFFWVASISTFYGLYQQMSFQDWSINLYDRSLVLSYLYIILNFTAGYGFLFCRKWITTLFLLNTIIMGVVYSFFYLSWGISQQSALSACLLSLLVAGISFTLKKYLVASNKAVLMVSIYTVVLLVTVYMNYFFSI